MTTPEQDRPADRAGEQVEQTVDERSAGVASKDDLERAVEEKTALVRELAGSEPNVSPAAPAKKSTRKAAAKKTAGATKAPAAKKAPAKAAPARRVVKRR